MSARDLFNFLAGALVACAAVLVWIMLHRGKIAAPVAAADVSSRAQAVPAAANEWQDIASSNPLSVAAAPGKAGNLEEDTARLAARLSREGGSSADWQLLAESYEFLGRSEEARAARTRAAQGASRVASSSNAAGASNTAGASNAAGRSGARIVGTVELAAQLGKRAPAGATVFVYARAAGAGGPPLAVLRVRADHWPISFALGDGDAMIPGRALSGAGSVELEARISLTGDALPHSGDLVGTISNVDPQAGRPVRIAIDHAIG